MAREDDDERKAKRRKHSHGERKDAGEKEKRGELPFNARELSKEDYEKYRPVFTVYLREKKSLDIDEISSSEA